MRGTSQAGWLAGRSLLRRGLCLGFAVAVRPVLALGDAGALAAQAAQVIELGATDLAAAHHLDRVDHRRIEREYALDAFAVRNLAHGEILLEARAGTADADALVGLDAAALAFDHLDVDDHRVAGTEIRDF